MIEGGPSIDAEQLPGVVRDPQVALLAGYKYGVTRYADLILRDTFPRKFLWVI